MIHGKFFAGLPPKMMDRTTGPNRQQSNLFWPDESDVESASESQSRRKHKISQQTSVESASPNSTDVEPKELSKKQLTSKIEFYDTADETKSSTAKTDTPSGRQKKLDPFSSKIEFYDFAGDSSQHLPKTDKNSKKDLERNSKNSPKTIDKKITFVEDNSTEHNISLPRGILKNNEVSAKKKPVQEQSRKKLIKKRNLSKSVENLSTRPRDSSDDEDDCIKVIANDVKSIAINDPKFSEKEVSVKIIDNHGTRSNIKLDTLRKTERVYYEDEWDSPEQIDENFYRKSGGDRTHVIYREIGHEFLNDHEDRHIRSKNNRVHTPNQTLKLEASKDSDSFASCPPTENNIILNNDNWFRTEKTVKSSNSLDQHQGISQPPSYCDRSEQSVNNRAHRHLVSNISFGNDIEATTDRPQKSVRSSAVMRVSVGLPD